MEPLQQLETARESLAKFNAVASALNLPQLILINPKDCVGQEKNARYYSQEVFKQLTENIKADQRLESVPLVYKHESEEGKYRIISGHHRIDAAKQAGLQVIIVFLIEPKDKDEIISKQLSHNSLVGKDDKMILKELYNEIDDINKKMAAGVQAELEKIDYASLNFKIGTYKEVIFLFLPEEEEKFEEVAKELKNFSFAGADTTVYLCNYKIFDRFGEVLRTIKKDLNIKSNPIAISKMVELSEEWLISQSQIKENEEGRKT